jgi:predicted ribonuclease YlaK
MLNLHRIHVVPDTSALLDSPELSSFGAPGYPVGVVLLPVVLDELDRLKDSARKANTKHAAQGLIRQIAGLRKGGTLLHRQRVSAEVAVIAVGMEPRSEAYPLVLNPGIDDDRFIAGALAFGAQHFSEATIVSTSDINMANKAALVGIQSVPAPTFVSVK